MANGFHLRSTGGRGPGWIVTFADMMALLLTFFILLFSFSIMDATRYHEIAQALEGAFGPGAKKKFEQASAQNSGISSIPQEEPVSVDVDMVTQLKTLLSREIEQGMMDIEVVDKQTIVRFPDRIAFSTASEELTPRFGPMLDKVVSVITHSTGSIVVAGHTDDRPISTEKFRSNWDLSTARAVSVIHAILARSNIEPSRLVAQGFAETRPIKPNTDETGRAANRRVEIMIMEAPASDQTPKPSADSAPAGTQNPAS